MPTFPDLRRWASSALCLMLVACATRAAVPDERHAAAALADDRNAAAAVAAHRTWWQAYATGDEETLAAHTAAEAHVVFGAGVRLPRGAVVEAAGMNSPASGFAMTWSDETVEFSRDGLAVVSGTATERAGASEQVFRLTAVLDRAGEPDWQARFLQSTRVARFAPAVPSDVSGALGDYAGAYTTPKGRLLRMEMRDGALWMVEPDGKAFALTATGPALFESTALSPLNGVIRFAFARDASGAVVSFSRLTEGRVDTFPRAE